MRNAQNVRVNIGPDDLARGGGGGRGRAGGRPAAAGGGGGGSGRRTAPAGPVEGAERAGTEDEPEARGGGAPVTGFVAGAGAEAALGAAPGAFGASVVQVVFFGGLVGLFALMVPRSGRCRSRSVGRS